MLFHKVDDRLDSLLVNKKKKKEEGGEDSERYLDFSVQREELKNKIFAVLKTEKNK